MEEIDEQPIDDILKEIRKAIMQKEQKEYFQSFMTSASGNEEVFELSKSMLVNPEDVPYRMGVWSFSDVAKKMLKKYALHFAKQTENSGRVRVKEDI